MSKNSASVQVGSGESFANDDEDIMEEQDKEEDWEDVEEWDQDYPVTRSTYFTFIKIQTIEFHLYRRITQPIVLCGR